MSKTFCRGELAPFDSKEFARWTNGVEIHIITTTKGHTTDGVPAEYKAVKDDANQWTVEEVVFYPVPLDVGEAE